MTSSTRLLTIPTSQLATTTGGFLLSGAPVSDPDIARGTNAIWPTISKSGAPSGSKSGTPSGSKTPAPPVTSKPSAPPLVRVSLQDAHR